VKTVFDSSAWAKRYIEEAGSRQVDEICQVTAELGLSVICVPEIVSALNRRLREGYLLSEDYRKAKAQLTNDIRDAFLLNLTPPVIATAVALLESNVLRAMDSLHVACAAEWQADLFVSSDHRQLAAAQSIGLNIRLV